MDPLVRSMIVITRVELEALVKPLRVSYAVMCVSDAKMVELESEYS